MIPSRSAKRREREEVLLRCEGEASGPEDRGCSLFAVGSFDREDEEGGGDDGGEEKKI